MAFTPTNNPTGQISGGNNLLLFYATGQTSDDRYIYGACKLAAPITQTFHFASFLYFPTNTTYPITGGAGMLYTFSSFTNDWANGGSGGPNFGPRSPSGVASQAATNSWWYVRENTGTTDYSGNNRVLKPGTTMPGALNYVVARFNYTGTPGAGGHFASCDLWVNPDYRSNNVPDCTYTYGSTSFTNFLYLGPVPEVAVFQTA